ncbi:PLP-dependent aminotransferase family protein [Hoeflea sp. YIM 152468]|uniref:MocR-like pyridoxine biosynthesis transcription factor PdxR n=1 Tax=Hoeflea sp. YIM 152468 TaxID=3031759 RepID=UPI0023DC811F|nr:PLP-dependent aminotransferase family protein [Hoeflea sp. YIM 152468]MDF1610448.1 PLP-dependent aminotransferase family protein [Hoeflea sp. YIM 152468]
MTIPIDTFFLDPKFEGTLQQKIQRMISEGVLSGRFIPGVKMPSSRKLATHLGISRITVTLAYSELVSDDYLIAKGRSGYYVSPTAPQRTRFDAPRGVVSDQVDWGRAIGQRFSSQVMPEKPIDWRSYPYPFIYGQADENIFDHSNWRQCALQALGKRAFSTVTADSYERDDPELVKYIALNTLPRRGIHAKPEQILITMGAQNALWLCAEVLLNQRRVAAMENPGYPGLRGVLNLARCTVASIPVDDSGLQLNALPRETDVVFTTPSHHCPTNVTMPLERRHGLLEMASEHDFLIVEDDYEFEMSFLNPPEPALKSLDEEGRVIYIGSFSKSLFPGLRLGYVVGSEIFIREARALRAAILRHPPGHLQRTAANFLSLGHYDALVARMGQVYRKRREIMQEALTRCGLPSPGLSVAGGSSFWMKTPEGIDARDLARDLKERGVLIEPGDVFFERPEDGARYYRIAYSSIESSKIASGIELIAQTLAAICRR